MRTVLHHRLTGLANLVQLLTDIGPVNRLEIKRLEDRRYSSPSETTVSGSSQGIRLDSEELHVTKLLPVAGFENNQ